MRPELRRALVQVCSATTERDVCAVLAGAIVLPTTALARFWLCDAQDRLHLAASAGFPIGGGTYNRIDGEFSLIPGSHGKIGQIAATREPLIVRGIRGDEEWLANPGWISRQGVRAFVGLPLIAADQAIGVMSVFDRAIPTEDALDELRFLADFAAARLVDLASHSAAGAFAPAPPVAPPPRVAPPPPVSPAPAVAPASPVVITRAEARAREKANIEAALAVTRGKVFGEDGAAMLLGMRPTTLASRIKALGVTRQRSATRHPS